MNTSMSPSTRDRGPQVLAAFAVALEAQLRRWVDASDEGGLDPSWQRARELVREFTLRPSKRVRPMLVAVGWLIARGEAFGSPVPAEVTAFSVGLELLHTFMLIHDDVADRAPLRRGGPALHRLLASGRLGEDLAVVAGDHLYARALEAMFSAPSAAAVGAGLYVLQVCRHTAIGQHLDLALSHAPLPEVTLFRTLKVAELKTARYGFVAPLVCGAMLGGASEALIDLLKRVGRHAGLAYQLRDDLLGLYGADGEAGKSGGGDFLEGKRTFPLVAAWTRADSTGRQELEALWGQPSPALLERARSAVARWGGAASTRRVVEVRSRAALRALEVLRPTPGSDFLKGLLVSLARSS